VIVAPSVTDAAVEVVTAKKNVRLLTTGEWSGVNQQRDYKRVAGGLLVQDGDIELYNDMKVVTEVQPSSKLLTVCLRGK